MVTGAVPSTPRYVPPFLSRIGFSIPTARRFSSNVANARSCAFRDSIFYARKSPYEYALGETRTHEIDLSRHADHLPSHRGLCRGAGVVYNTALPSAGVLRN